MLKYLCHLFSVYEGPFISSIEEGALDINSKNSLTNEEYDWFHAHSESSLTYARHFHFSDTCESPSAGKHDVTGNLLLSVTIIFSYMMIISVFFTVVLWGVMQCSNWVHNCDDHSLLECSIVWHPQRWDVKKTMIIPPLSVVCSFLWFCVLDEQSHFSGELRAAEPCK